MGHSSVRAALIYQHLINGRDHEIAGHVDDQIRQVKGPGPDPSGT
ncbi:integrase [Actinacidiphila glaucinigra]